MKTKTRNLLVYRYEFWDEQRQSMRTSETYATLDAILKGLGIPLLDTTQIHARAIIEFAMAQATA